jgi:hypothetical protein
MTLLVDIYNAIIDVFNQIQNFITDGIYQLLVEFTAWAIKKMVIASIQFKIWALGFAWDVAQEIITSLNINTYLNAAWGSLHADTLAMFQFFKIPEAVQMLLSASVTKFVFRFLGL